MGKGKKNKPTKSQPQQGNQSSKAQPKKKKK